MVEGPGTTRNARKLQQVVTHRVVPPVPVQQHHHHQQQHQQQPQTSRAPLLSCLTGKTLLQAFSVGKELFLIFSDDLALRLHFGMNGSLLVKSNTSNNSNTIKNYAYKKQSLSLQLHFQKEVPVSKASDQNFNTCNNNTLLVLECFSTTVSLVTTRVALSKRDRLQARDVCGNDATFDPMAVMNALRTRQDAMISDVLLDQNRFPGVGNIIKIEGLHSARIHPKRLVENLSDDELLTVIQQCRQYAMKWLSSGRAPPKCVYNLTICGTCQSTKNSVKMVKLGNDLSRVTFWCELCQPFNINTIMSSTACEAPTTAEVPTTELSIAGKRALSDIPVNTGLFQRAPKQPKLQVSQDKNKQTIIKNACPQHGERTFCIRRVRHKEETRHRLFGTCRIQGCPFFTWMDSHFPNCPQCRRKTVLRVSKKEQSSGRWFLSCNNTRCKGTFAWATPQQLESFGKFLTPLL